MENIIVMCQIIQVGDVFEGVIINAMTKATLISGLFRYCPEDTEAALESIVLQNNWRAVPWKI